MDTLDLTPDYFRGRRIADIALWRDNGLASHVWVQCANVYLEKGLD